MAQLFEEVASNTPQAPAVETAGRVLSYRELNALANQVAHFLRGRGVGPDTPVAICTERSIELVIAQLGILKAGGAYLPLDASYPQDRLAMMLEDTGASVLLTQSHLRDAMPAGGQTEIVCLDADWDRIGACSEENPVSNVTGENLAYIIYTSGSTGRPKGVPAPHRGIVRLVRGQDYAPFGPEERYLVLASPSFDGIIFELWGALLNGGCCVIFPDRLPEFGRLEQVIREQRVSCLFLTTGLFNQIIDHRPKTLATARTVLVGGEALSARHIRRAQEILPHLKLINGYGPTECTTFACAYRIGPAAQWQCGSVPIGLPLNNTECYIVDETLAPVAINQPGELLLGGLGLARGYFRRPGLTAEKFIPHPFSPDPAARLYRTGDRCRWLPNGLIEYLGRIDDQIKLRGYRIEPGEIEAVLRRLPGVRNCAVFTRDIAAGRQLVACVVADEERAPAPADLRSQLLPLLPDYMVPAVIRLIDELPLTPNGKVNRRALAGLFAAAAEPDPGAAAVAGKGTKETLLGLWRKVLQAPALGEDGSFFEHGGDSLLSIQLTLEIERALGRRVPLGAIYETPSPAAFAARWDGASAGPALKGSGPGTPLFHLPGIAGVVRMAPAFVGALEGRRPYYDELMYPSLRDGSAPFESVEEIAAEMVRQIRSIRATGPYCLSGYSFGGLVAYEVARQLAAAGERVEKLVLWDPILADMMTRKTRLQMLQGVLDRLGKRYAAARKTGRLSLAFGLSSSNRAKIGGFLGRLRPAGRPRRYASPDVDTTAACFRAFYRFKPQPYDGDMVLIKCSDPDLDLLSRLNYPQEYGWRPFVRGTLTVHDIACRHSDLLQEPHLSRSVQLTREALEK